MAKSSRRRLCNRCRTIVAGPCPRCDTGWTARPTERKVKTSDWSWRKLRAQVLREEPVCQVCHEAPSAEVDHITPLSQGGAEMDRANLQGICRPCHKRKTARESRPND